MSNGFYNVPKAKKGKVISPKGKKCVFGIAIVSEKKEALFNLGYGLTYKSNDQINLLPENSGLTTSGIPSKGIYFSKGIPIFPWD